MTAPDYIGRFAPSPTGPLHFGSLLAAVASFLDARFHAGTWILRIEDIDPPREIAGAAADIVRTLETFGFEWDGPVRYQRNSAAQHAKALQRLIDSGLTFLCDCSRRVLMDAPDSQLGKIYPGTCRQRAVSGDSAVRLRIDGTTSFHDQLQGPQSMDLSRQSGDFVVRRRDGLFAYHLAVVVDDIVEGVTHIVRGIDLMPSTHRQLYVQQCLEEQLPTYAHIPVAVHTDGSKLSKLTGATQLPLTRPQKTLCQALSALGQQPPDDLADGTLADVWRWAEANWRLSVLEGQTEILTEDQQE